jgi:tetratricopeptide (TPR) repeat protein
VPGAVDGRLRALERSRIEERPTILPIERYREVGGVALAVLVLAALAERFGRFPARAGLAFGVIALLFGACATEAHQANEAGRDALRDGNPDLAIEKFLDAQVARPEDPEIALNLASAYAAAGRYDEAVRSARRALASNRPETRARAYSSIGHHQFAAERLPDALDAFRRSLLESPSDEARHDYEVVLRLLFPDAPPAGPTPSATVDSAGTPPLPQGTPTPGSGSGNGGIQTPVPGTPTPGGSGGGRGTPTAGSGPSRPDSLQDLERQLQALDEQIDRLVEEAGEAPTTAQAYEILRLLAERSRIAGLRSAFEGGGDPDDY